METYSAESAAWFNDDPAKSLVLWQFNDGRWKNYADYHPEDNVALEKAFQSKQKSTTISHGWNDRFTIDFAKKTSAPRRGRTQQIRRWVRETPSQIKIRKDKELRDAFLRKNGSKAIMLWSRYAGSDSFDFSKLIEEDLTCQKNDMTCLCWFWIAECDPSRMNLVASLKPGHGQNAFMLALAKLGATDVKTVKSSIQSKITQLKASTLPDAVRRAKAKGESTMFMNFYKFCFMFASHFHDAADIKSSSRRMAEDGMYYNKTDFLARRVDSDGVGYPFSSFVDCYGDGGGEEWGIAKPVDTKAWDTAPLQRADAVAIWREILRFGSNANKIKLASGSDVGAVDLFIRFIEERPTGYDIGDTIGADEWEQIYGALSTLQPSFKDFDEYAAPSLVSEFKEWVTQDVAKPEVEDSTMEEADGVW